MLICFNVCFFLKTDEQALQASWEPRHSCYRLPWQQYVKLGGVLRHFGYTVVALHGCLQTEIQVHISYWFNFYVSLFRRLSYLNEEKLLGEAARMRLTVLYRRMYERKNCKNTLNLHPHGC